MGATKRARELRAAAQAEERARQEAARQARRERDFAARTKGAAPGPAQEGGRSQAGRSQAGRGAVAAPVEPGPALIPERWSVWIWLALAAVIALPAILYRLGDLPIVWWDEARVVASSVEMSQTGFSLVPTWVGEPDMWYAKPPLMIWLQAASVLLLGVSEFAVRLPSALAALGTGLLVFVFLGRYLRRPIAAFVAVAILFSNAGWLGFHAVRAGDIEATLTLLTMGWLIAAWFYFEDEPERRGRWLLALTLLLAADFMVKSIQGFIPLPGVFLYALWRGRLRSTLTDRRVWVAMASIAVLVVGYFAVKEVIQPGYFNQAVIEDLLGRTTATLQNHEGPPSFYFDFAMGGMYGHPAAFPLIIPALLALGALAWAGPGRVRYVARFFGLAGGYYLLQISLTTSKLMWYIVPLLPVLSIGLGLSVDAALGWLSAQQAGARRLVEGAAVAGALVLVAIIVPMNNGNIDERIAGYRSAGEYQAAVYLRDTLIPEGVPADFAIVDDPGFLPVYFYARHLGGSPTQPPVIGVGPLPDGTSKVVVCGQRYQGLLDAGVRLEPIRVDGSCGLFAVTSTGTAVTP